MPNLEENKLIDELLNVVEAYRHYALSRSSMIERVRGLCLKIREVSVK